MLEYMTTKRTEITISYQGAFAPPTLGHFETMRLLAIKGVIDNPDSDIKMLFM